MSRKYIHVRFQFAYYYCFTNSILNFLVLKNTGVTKYICFIHTFIGNTVSLLQGFSFCFAFVYILKSFGICLIGPNYLLFIMIIYGNHCYKKKKKFYFIGPLCSKICFEWEREFRTITEKKIIPT